MIIRENLPYLAALLVLSSCVADPSANPSRCETDADCDASEECLRTFCLPREASSDAGMDAATDADTGPPCNPCYDGPEPTREVGVCRDGCLVDGVCEGQVLPAEDEGAVCDGRDNDCNGFVDDGEGDGFDFSTNAACGACEAGCASGQSCCENTTGDGPSHVCANFASDPNHCGGCAGDGGITCQPDQTCCSGECVDIRSEEDHCGACGIRCGPGRECCDGRCIDPRSSAEHCGGCAAGPDGEACDDGDICCLVPEGEGATPGCVPEADRATACAACDESCTDDCCDGVCVDVDAEDDLNCGGCGNACEANERCCGGTCVARDSACSACGDACGGSEFCCSGACESRLSNLNCQGCGVSCGSGENCCESGCTDTRTDPRNCGACAEAGGDVCPSGQECCGGTCRNTDSDNDHCGRCGNSCGALAPCCRGGRCRSVLGC